MTLSFETCSLLTCARVSETTNVSTRHSRRPKTTCTVSFVEKCAKELSSLEEPTEFLHRIRKTLHRILFCEVSKTLSTHSSKAVALVWYVVRSMGDISLCCLWLGISGSSFGTPCCMGKKVHPVVGGSLGVQVAGFRGRSDTHCSRLS